MWLRNTISITWWHHATSAAFSKTSGYTFPDSKVHGANMGPTWRRQDPGGLHVGPMNLVIWVWLSFNRNIQALCQQILAYLWDFPRHVQLANFVLDNMSHQILNVRYMYRKQDKMFYYICIPTKSLVYFRCEKRVVYIYSFTHTHTFPVKQLAGAVLLCNVIKM